MPFIVRSAEAERPESPEALFRSLRPRDRSVRDLLLRQGDALRAYATVAPDTRDLAIELPTGAGKTLVGLLIAEWRRQALGHRVAYLCPTVQLVRQVANKAEQYGLDVVPLVRRQSEWDSADFNRFQRGQAVAISGYSQVFNSNPRLDSAQTLILDDAHAAEDAVSSNWSVVARRQNPLYAALAAALRDHIPEQLFRQLDREYDPTRASEVSLVSPHAVADAAPAIEEALDAFAVARDDSNTYTKKMLGESVGRCLVYVSPSQILIRPLIAPTSQHRPFANADQRIYMSATLGSAGELQRAFGVPKIDAIAASPDDPSGHGRRFFVLPHASQTEPDRVIQDAVKTAGRAVLLAPSQREAESALAAIVPENVPVISAQEVEDGFEPFTDEQAAVLNLTNRYDGVDLPDEACRLVIMSGLPAHAHLQERFLMDWLGARRVLSERIRMRIQQGAGRATRNARDYAAVIIRGAPLTDFVARTEELLSMPPQLRVELDFGFLNSESPDVDLGGLLKSFWAQDSEWQAAESELQRQTALATREVNPADSALALAAPSEVACWDAVNANDLPRAIDLAQEVTDHLIGGNDLRPYRALWFYLAASWAGLLAREDPQTWSLRAAALKLEADGCAKPFRWTPVWAETTSLSVESDARSDRARLAAAELRRLGIRGNRFDAFVTETTAALAADDASKFEAGLQRLGALLGFDSLRPSGQADPDSAWRDGEELWLLAEAKTEESPENLVSVASVRQARTHADWVSNVEGWPAPSQTLTVLVARKTSIDSAAVPLADEVCLCHPDEYREIAERLGRALTQVRAGARGMSDPELEAAITKSFAEHRLTNPDLVEQLGRRRVADG